MWMYKYRVIKWLQFEGASSWMGLAGAQLQLAGTRPELTSSIARQRSNYSPRLPWCSTEAELYIKTFIILHVDRKHLLDGVFSDNWRYLCLTFGHSVHLLTKSTEGALGFAHGMTLQNFDWFQPLQHVGSIHWPCAWCTGLVRASQPWRSAILSASTRYFSKCFNDWIVFKSSLTKTVQPSPGRHKAALCVLRFAFPSTRLAAPPCAGLHQRDASLLLPCVAPANPNSEFRIELHQKHSLLNNRQGFFNLFMGSPRPATPPPKKKNIKG